MLTLNFNLKNWLRIIIPAFALFAIVGCGDDDDMNPTDPGTVDDPIASFQLAIDETDFLTVAFTNFSQNAETYAWDFGDTNTSAEENPTHTYAAAGDYTITLTATNSEGTSASRSESITITDPNSAAQILTGTAGKTWKLYREGTSMSVGPDAENPGGFWPGLTNDGSRPCLYLQEFTFNPDGSYVFNDNGGFWAEFGVFNNVAGCDMNTEESCFEATAANMVNACGDDVSAWLSGSHTFEYDATTGTLTLNGQGAWIGIPKLGTTGEFTTPQSTVSASITIEENNGFDVMLVEFDYGGVYWPIRYASYSDASLEPELVTEAEPPAPFGEDLPDATPTSLEVDFSMPGSIDTITSGSTIEYGVADPAGSTDLVGQFGRPAVQFQELQFQTTPEANDIIWSNMTSATVDVYFPSSNDYTGTLTKNVIIGLADFSATEQWWTDHQQYEWDGSAAPEDEWVTITFDLSTPSFVANPGNGMNPYERNDYDMMFLQIGSGGHDAEGTFFVRNLRFE